MSSLLPGSSSELVMEFACEHGYKFSSFVNDFRRFIGEHEPKTLSFISSIIEKDSVVIDVGAHVGFHSVHFAKLGARVIALEPVIENFMLLMRNIEKNFVYNTVALPFAASNIDGKVKIYISGASSGAHSVEPWVITKPLYVREVPSVRLDTLIRKLELEEVDIIKIDVEKHESKVIEGLNDALRGNMVRALVVEISDENKELVDLLARRFRETLFLDRLSSSVNVAFLR